MKLKFYNTLTRKKDDFIPMDEKEVGFYSCGPTVYNYAHIGNLRTYVFNDVLKRVLRYNGYNVKHVMNITDVGHLTDDADEGEDKMEKGAKREGKTVWDIARYYTEAFQQDISELNILDPDVWPKATEHIEDMIDINKKLEENGYTYKAGGNLYYDASKFEHYSELARLKVDDLEEGARTEVDSNKKNQRDFVLWFSLEGSKFGMSHSMKWPSPWGIGYPGWHIECTAMSSRYLGEQFDIHTGGIDHIPVHHTNEIAQAEGAFGKHPWVKYWLHGNFLVVRTGKMAKSGENFLTLRVLKDKGYDPLAYRFFCLQAHYRSELVFSWEAMDSAQKGFQRFRNRVLELKKKAADNKQGSSKVDSSYTEKFDNAVNDDMNMPIAISTAIELLNDDSVAPKDKYDALLRFDSVLGLGVKDFREDKVEVSQEIQDMLDQRAKARAEKDFSTADSIRDKVRKLGYEIKDTQDGQKLENK